MYDFHFRRTILNTNFYGFSVLELHAFHIIAGSSDLCHLATSCTFVLHATTIYTRNNG